MPPRGTVSLECRRRNQEDNIATGLLDLSDGGVRVLSTSALQPDERVEVQFDAFGVPGTIVRSATVVWSLRLQNRQFAAGLRFKTPLSSQELLQLARS